MTEELQPLITRNLQQVSNLEPLFDRYLYKKINWENRLILIKGARGVGKTTLLLRHIMLNQFKQTEALYASLDDLWFNKYSIVQLGEWWVLQGGNKLFLDEVHKYPEWTREIKIIYDRFPHLQVVITGSSAIELHKGEGDLSRRARVYSLHGLSFREFIQLETKMELPPCSLSDLLANSTEISLEFAKKFKPFQYFDNYLKSGYYPFYKEDSEGYRERLLQTLQVVLETDIPAIQHIDFSSVLNIKKLLAIIADLVPYKPNISKLSTQTGVSRETLVKYIHYLTQAGVVNSLFSNTNGTSLLNKPEKLYLNNTNLVFALSIKTPDKGTIRETFAVNQLSTIHNLSYPDTADILVDNTYLFEIGGKNKSRKQISGRENAFVLADEIEFAQGNKIPLWLMGMLY